MAFERFCNNGWSSLPTVEEIESELSEGLAYEI